MVYVGFEAQKKPELKHKSCWIKIVYPGVEASKKYCLSRDWSR